MGTNKRHRPKPSKRIRVVFRDEGLLCSRDGCGESAILAAYSEGGRVRLGACCVNHREILVECLKPAGGSGS